ncbi:flagellar export protein FliJ [Psychrosphaera aestuarii]|uniref:flagellar export protein FliJ n=1 Tax=Psychrosphaera aestuarii TaxID=1266052 RepID=UPI001B331585|nr:flagellar export protein FliJ [Psychrosphaera aestuarii]
MSKDDNQLLVLKKIESDKEQQAITAMQSAQAYLQSNEAKLREVQSYKLDYLKRMQERGVTGIGGASYQHYQRFIVQLDQGISAQANVVDIAKQVVEQRKQEWFMQKNKVKAVDTLLTKKAQERQQRIDKFEQNQSDEFASQQYIRRKLAI